MCDNGGSLDTDNCTCDCVDGFSGGNCESECIGVALYTIYIYIVVNI